MANGGREGEVRYLGEIDNSIEATRKLVAKLAAKYDQLHFYYEAGPRGRATTPGDKHQVLQYIEGIHHYSEFKSCYHR